jgi:hypothetical protein
MEVVQLLRKLDLLLNWFFLFTDRANVKKSQIDLFNVVDWPQQKMVLVHPVTHFPFLLYYWHPLIFAFQRLLFSIKKCNVFMLYLFDFSRSQIVKTSEPNTCQYRI